MNERGQGFIEYVLMLGIIMIAVVGVIIAIYTLSFVWQILNTHQPVFSDDILSVTENCMNSNTSAVAISGMATKFVNADGFLSCLYTHDITLSVRGDPVVTEANK